MCWFGRDSDADYNLSIYRTNLHGRLKKKNRNSERKKHNYDYGCASSEQKHIITVIQYRILKMCNRFPAISAESANFLFSFETYNTNGWRKLWGKRTRFEWKNVGGDIKWISVDIYCNMHFIFVLKEYQALNWNQSANEAGWQPAVVRMTNVDSMRVCV